MVEREDPLVARLRAAGCVFAEDEAALLRSEARDPQHLQTLAAARERGTPLEQVLGWAELAGTRVRVHPGVFVPRRRSALLVDLAARHLPGGGLLVDLCCGSGALAAAVLARRPDVSVHAADLDPGAVRCARTNLPPGRVHEGDLYDALPRDLRGHVDVLVVNAPYVPTGRIALLPPEARDHEPAAALDGGADGLDVQRRVLADAPAWLAPRGVVLVETGADQAARTLAAARDAGLRGSIERDPEIGGCALVATRPRHR